MSTGIQRSLPIFCISEEHPHVYKTIQEEKFVMKINLDISDHLHQAQNLSKLDNSLK